MGHTVYKAAAAFSVTIESGHAKIGPGACGVGAGMASSCLDGKPPE